MYWDHDEDPFLFRLTFSRLDPAVLNGSLCPAKRELFGSIWQTAISQRWLSTNLNAADDATRAKYPERFFPDNRWLQGPEFLSQAESQLPVNLEDTLCEDGVEEVRPLSVHLVSINGNISHFENYCFRWFSQGYIRTKTITTRASDNSYGQPKRSIILTKY